MAQTALSEPTAFSPDWAPEEGVSDAESLIEASGRACYGSWTRPNPATATNQGYIDHILDVEHFSVLRHGVATLYIEGISRSCSMELIRHHVGISYSQLSQRYVDSSDMNYVVPPAMRRSLTMKASLNRAWGKAIEDYAWAVQSLEREGRTRKQAREAARAFLPNCAETKIVVTANFQAWRNFIEQRATPYADAEIRELAEAVREKMIENFPNAFQDMVN